MVRLIFLAILMLCAARAADAQVPARVRIEGHAGHAEFADSPPIEHSVVGGSARVYVSHRLAIGPEVTLMRGSGADRDWFLLGSATVDLGAIRPDRRWTPYLVAGAGLLRHTSEVGTGLFTSTEVGFDTGIGLRIAPHPRWSIAPEARLGSELHWRVGAAVGVAID